MPKQHHETLIDMFRERPTLAAELLRGPLHDKVPAFDQARLSASRAVMEAFMKYKKFTYQSGLFRRLDHQGQTKGEIQALLILLDARGIDVPVNVRNEITSCTSLRQLGRWIRQAATAERIEDLGFQVADQALGR